MTDPASFRRCSVFVRILQKGADLRRNLRGFPRCALSKTGAHLRTQCAPSKQGAALDPVPLIRVRRDRHLLRLRSHCVVLNRVSSTSPLSRISSTIPPSRRGQRTSHCSAPGPGPCPGFADLNFKICVLLRNLRITCLFSVGGAHSELTRSANKKSRAGIFHPGTAPRMRDLQLVAVPYFVVR